MGDITSANATATLLVNNTLALPGPVQLEGWSTDDAFTTEPITPVEARKGVDGKTSFGYTPYLLKVRLTFMADSPSLIVFDIWRQAMDATKQPYTANLEILVPAVSKVFTYSFGSLTNAAPGPMGRRVLEAQTQEITFDRLITAPAIT